MNKEELITVYTALLEISNEEKKCRSNEVSQRAGLEVQETRIILDELEHMGFVEKRDRGWYPKIQLNDEEED